VNEKTKKTKSAKKIQAVKLAVIGGSGLYNIEGLKDVRELKVKTPFGNPSDAIVIGKLGGHEVAFLPRHGRGHRILPTEVNSQANIWALKSIGVERIISVSAVGSLRKDYKPMDLVIPDQVLDRTRRLPNTYFGNGVVGHITFAEPFCEELRQSALGATKGLEIKVHNKGTLVCMEGPAFSTLAESNLYRSWKMDIIGMTVLPEAKLAREAEICYATLAFVTDYDCWHGEHESVTVDMVVANLLKNVDNAKKIITRLVPEVPEGERTCPCASALQNAIMTDKKKIPAAARKKLGLFLGKYLK